MDRFYRWSWDRHGARYSWVIFGVAVVVPFPIYLFLAFFIVAFENSGRYLAAAAAVGVAMPVFAYALILPGRGGWRAVQRWAAGDDVDAGQALSATYAWVRFGIIRVLPIIAVWAALLSILVGAIAGAPGVRLAQYAVLGAVVGISSHLIGVHSLPETMMRPVRAALAGDSGIGDDLPGARPTFALWSNVSIFGAAWVFSIAGAMAAAVFDAAGRAPVLPVVIGCALAVGLGLPITVGNVFAPSLQPIRDLSDATKRVTAGDYSRRLPVVQDDDLGVLAASFNRMQAGLAERRRLQVAFGTYVDPGLAVRLLQQGDDVFTGERREVTVMFIDIRDFTPFAEANAAEDVVARLNALFEIVVPAIVDSGGHVNKFLGDGALAVFGAPNDLADHADAAVDAAVLIHGRVVERFDRELRIGIGINTGPVIAGTIGAAGKLESTLIGDTVNVAARVEQLTKTTGDTILLTGQSVDALAARPSGLADRGFHTVKGKATTVQVFGLDPAATPLQHPG